MYKYVYMYIYIYHIYIYHIYIYKNYILAYYSVKYLHDFSTSKEKNVTDVMVWKCWTPMPAAMPEGPSKFKEHDAQGPQIHFDPVAFALKDLDLVDFNGNCLVVSTYPSEKSWSSSAGIMTNWMESHSKFHGSSHHQPGISGWSGPIGAPPEPCSGVCRPQCRYDFPTRPVSWKPEGRMVGTRNIRKWGDLGIIFSKRPWILKVSLENWHTVY